MQAEEVNSLYEMTIPEEVLNKTNCISADQESAYVYDLIGM